MLTEVDKYDTPSATSKEADPISQMIARTDSFGTMGSIVFMECTVSIESGRIWTEYTGGTESRLGLKCRHCGGYVTPEREHLVGYQTATNELDAREQGHFVCPSCTAQWTEEDRVFANQNSVLVHRGQTVNPDGSIAGDPPRTLTAGFRWTAANNLLRPAADIAGDEWKVLNKPDDETSQKKMMQFVWAMPWTGETAGTGITDEIVASRLNGLQRGELPEDCDSLVCQIDLHLRWHYWEIMATSSLAAGVPSISGGVAEGESGGGNDKQQDGEALPRIARDIIDYGVSWNPDRAKFGIEGSIKRGLELLGEQLDSRQFVTTGGRIVELDFVLVDGGYHQEIGTEFVTSMGRKWKLSKGQGRADHKGNTKYETPKQATAEIRPGFHWNYRKQLACDESDDKPWWMVMADTDYWMHQVHSGFMATPFLSPEEMSPFEKLIWDKTKVAPRRPGSIALFGRDPQVHLRNIDAEIVRSNFAQQVVGWVWKSKKTKDRGTQIGWFSQWEQDHWLDTTYGCLVADSVLRKYHPRFRPQVLGPVAPEGKKEGYKMPDGRPYLITQRDHG